MSVHCDEEDVKATWHALAGDASTLPLAAFTNFVSEHVETLVDCELFDGPSQSADCLGKVPQGCLLRVVSPVVEAGRSAGSYCFEFLHPRTLKRLCNHPDFKLNFPQMWTECLFCRQT